MLANSSVSETIVLQHLNLERITACINTANYFERDFAHVSALP